MNSLVAQHNELNKRLIKALRGICSYWEYNTIIVSESHRGYFHLMSGELTC